MLVNFLVRKNVKGLKNAYRKYFSTLYETIITAVQPKAINTPSAGEERKDAMQGFYQSLTLYGKVTEIDAKNATFKLLCRSSDIIQVKVRATTWFNVLTNLDNIGRDRVADPENVSKPEPVTPSWNVAKYIKDGTPLMVMGIYQENGDERCLEASTIHLPHWQPKNFLFEETHWWLDQIALMADKWLDDLFDSTRSYKIDDFSKFYRTNLNITGGPTNDTVQECATLSRLIYGLSSAYLLTGSDRYLLAAKAGVAYQRESYRSLSHDGEYCFWAFGRRPGVDGSKLVVMSENSDDLGTIPLYEQIYAIAGLAHYYRITLDWEVLEDIRRTVNAFLAFYYDNPEAKINKGFPGLGGYFSHLDYATMRPDTEGLGMNRSRKNWNSIGDHIPAYLIDLLLSLDPVPKGPGNRKLTEFQTICRQILDETSKIIVKHFPDPNSDYVNERFLEDFTPDHSWGWQQNRAIVGHNLKIAWNLSRIAFYYQAMADKKLGNEKQKLIKHADKCLALAKDIGRKIAEVGLDKIRGGIFDAVERKPGNSMPVEFAWGSTKDFWQQEQGILAYLILHGADSGNALWLELARESEMFWNCFFLDRDRQGIFFRTNENGDPVVRGGYANKGGHSISGYHAFELNYLAHLYTRAFVVKDHHADNNFCLYFKIGSNCEQLSINVLPDFFPPKLLRINRIRVNGIDRTEDLKPNSDDDFQIAVEQSPAETELAVEFIVRT